MDGLSGMFIPKQKFTTKVGEKILTDPALTHVSEQIEKSIHMLSEGGGKVVLVIDQLDFLLAAGGEQVSVGGLNDMLLGLREVCVHGEHLELWLMVNTACLRNSDNDISRPASGRSSSDTT